MSAFKIITVLGARPQFIKAAMVSRELQKEKEIEEVIIHTGQHYDINMSDVFFEEMNIPAPKYNLGVAGGGHGSMTGRMMIGLEDLFEKEQPNLALVYGDTNSTLAAALTSRKMNIPVAHVEAGLRNFDLTIPEDVNRILTDRISDLLFCPTELAVKNLKQEGFNQMPCTIIKTGDLMYDAVKYYASLSTDKSQILKKLSLKKQGYVLCTIHRAHNTEAPGIFETFKALSEIAAEVQIVFPVHPRTKKALKKYGITLNRNIKIIEPQGYFNMVELLKNADCVITDSGGLQKEAYALAKKSLQLMDYTPWEELIDNGFSLVTDIKYDVIMAQWKKLGSMKPNFNLALYGDGNTSKEIIKSLLNFFHSKKLKTKGRIFF